MSDEFELVHGAGNVFADLGDGDVEAKQMKAKVAAEIIGTRNRRGLTVRAAAGGPCDPADIERICNADLARFSLDRLLRIAARLGQHFELRSIAPDEAA